MDDSGGDSEWFKYQSVSLTSLQKRIQLMMMPSSIYPVCINHIKSINFNPRTLSLPKTNPTYDDAEFYLSSSSKSNTIDEF